jgi:Tfp pilus assembly protein PilF
MSLPLIDRTTVPWTHPWPGRWRRGVVLGLPLVFGLACATVPDPATENFEKQAASHRDLGGDHLAKGNDALALGEFLAAAELAPTDPQIQHGLAEAYRRQGYFPDAEQHLLNCIAWSAKDGPTKSRPTVQLARLSLSSLYIQMERFDDAVTVSDLLVTDPTFPAPWLPLSNKGWAEYKLGKLDAARVSLGQALDYKHDFWRAQLNLGILESETGDKGEALELFDHVLAAKPGAFAEAEVHYRIGQIYVSMGQRDRAVQHLTAATQSRRSGEWGKRSEEYLKILQ